MGGGGRRHAEQQEVEMLLVRKVLSDKGELKLRGAEGARLQPREAGAGANHPTNLPIRMDFTCLEMLCEGGKTIGGLRRQWEGRKCRQQV